jgi:hypothetical protein
MNGKLPENIGDLRAVAQNRNNSVVTFLLKPFVKNSKSIEYLFSVVNVISMSLQVVSININASCSDDGLIDRNTVRCQQLNPSSKRRNHEPNDQKMQQKKEPSPYKTSKQECYCTYVLYLCCTLHFVSSIPKPVNCCNHCKPVFKFLSVYYAEIYFWTMISVFIWCRYLKKEIT